MLGSTDAPNAPATRPADMFAWEMGTCFGSATSNYIIAENDFADLRDVTLSIPISRLVPSISFADRTDLTISMRNVAF